MSDHLNIADFLHPIDLNSLSQDEGFKEGQLGKRMAIYAEEFPELDEAQIVIVGCGEQRGSGLIHGQSESPDIIRRYLYGLFTGMRISG